MDGKLFQGVHAQGKSGLCSGLRWLTPKGLVRLGHLEDSGDEYILCTHVHYLSGTREYEYLEDSGDEYSYLDQSSSTLVDWLIFIDRRVHLFLLDK